MTRGTAEMGVGALPDGGLAGELFKRAWWVLALRGILAIVLGVMMLTWPGKTLPTFVVTLGVYLFLDGLFTLAAAFHAAVRGRSWWPYMIEGLFSIGVGLLAFARPTSGVFVLVLLIAIRTVIVGMVEIGTGLSSRRGTGSAAWLLLFGGVASIAFGVLMLGDPDAGLIKLVWLSGFYSIAFGILMLASASKFRSATTLDHHATHPA
jgi:uncharacterized membrane protein HdeD (DUF308 family)